MPPGDGATRFGVLITGNTFDEVLGFFSFFSFFSFVSLGLGSGSPSGDTGTATESESESSSATSGAPSLAME